MAENNDKSKKGKRAARKAETSPSRGFFTAYHDLAETQQRTWSEVQRRCSEAQIELVARQQEIQRAAYEPVRQAQEKVQEAARAVTGDRDAWRAYQDAWQELRRVQWEVSSDPEIQEAFRDAYRACVEAQREACREGEEKLREAQQAYIGAIQSAWSDVDAASLDPATLSAIGWTTSIATSFR